MTYCVPGLGVLRAPIPAPARPPITAPRAMFPPVTADMAAPFQHRLFPRSTNLQQPYPVAAGRRLLRSRSDKTGSGIVITTMTFPICNSCPISMSRPECWRAMFRASHSFSGQSPEIRRQTHRPIRRPWFLIRGTVT